MPRFSSLLRPAVTGTETTAAAIVLLDGFCMLNKDRADKPEGCPIDS